MSIQIYVAIAAPLYQRREHAETAFASGPVSKMNWRSSVSHCSLIYLTSRTTWGIMLSCLCSIPSHSQVAAFFSNLSVKIFCPIGAWYVHGFVYKLCWQLTHQRRSVWRCTVNIIDKADINYVIGGIVPKPGTVQAAPEVTLKPLAGFHRGRVLHDSIA